MIRRVAKKSSLIIVQLAAAVSLLQLAIAPALAHPESISSVEVLVQKTGAKLSLTLQTRDLNAWFPPGGKADYKAFVLRGLKDQAGDLFEFSIDGRAIAPSSVNVVFDKPGCVRVDLQFSFVAGSQAINVRTKTLDKLPAGHQQLLCAEDSRFVANASDPPPVLIEQPLSADQDSVDIQLTDRSTSSSTTKP